MNKPELLAPCHDFPTLKAAVQSGADAIYFGVTKYNMRIRAQNFTTSDLKKISAYCHEHKVRAYLTVNSIIYENEIKLVEKLIQTVKKAKIDAIIIHDLSLIPICKKYKIPFHISTQANVSNSSSANLFKKLGASRVILAREVCLKDLKKLVSNSKIDVEVFIHGAMCASISGRCYLSHTLSGRSANRGDCRQPCRMEWKVSNESGSLIYDGERFMNARDLCTIEILDKIMKTGVKSLKIEGRMKDTNYVSTVVSVYREAIDNYSKSNVKHWLKRLKSVFNRGFSSGFYLGIPTKKDIEYKEKGSLSTHKRQLVGKVLNYYYKAKAAKIILVHTNLKIGDDIIIEGKTTFIKQKVSSIQIDSQSVKQASKKQVIALKVEDKVRKNDKIYKIKKA